MDIAVGKNFPLRNVWLSASVEDQKTANERRQPMRALARDGWLTWVSYEPALQAVDWTGWEFIKWLVAGGESGPEARPNHGRWFRTAARFCFMEKIPFFSSSIANGSTRWIFPSGIMRILCPKNFSALRFTTGPIKARVTVWARRPPAPCSTAVSGGSFQSDQ